MCSSCLLLHTAAAAIPLCECERAQGPPDGLGCDKEGWFISNFENQGTWVRQAGRHVSMQWSFNPGTQPPGLIAIKNVMKCML